MMRSLFHPPSTRLDNIPGEFVQGYNVPTMVDLAWWWATMSAKRPTTNMK